MGLNLKVTRMGTAPATYDPELDMRRHDSRVSGTLVGVWNALRRKLFFNTGATTAPMRSIAREAEESWPTRDWGNG